ncbi:MAG: dihydrofolate reductase [Planctomycetes bacterium]|nr:dihydrofolate reductase [Planctomycetota bacterium]MBI3844699.1 dihydrofolate reductase [Planctomycetota bacterium]
MRKVTYGGACSLDGFIAGKEGSIDWLHFSPDVQKFMAEFWPTIDTILMGRKTWDVSAAMGGGGAGGSGGMKTYVFSRTLKKSPSPDVELVTTDAVAFVKDLKRQKGKGICVMGGGDFARSLFEGDVIDEVGLNIHPILLGSGIPAFLDAGRRIALELEESRTIHGGCVLVTYRVRRAK